MAGRGTSPDHAPRDRVTSEKPLSGAALISAAVRLYRRVQRAENAGWDISAVAPTEITGPNSVKEPRGATRRLRNLDI